MSESIEQLRYPIGPFTTPEQFNREEIPSWIATLEAMPKWLDLIIENLDAHQLATPYRPEGWTMAQTIHHIADSHMNAFIRVKLALTEDAPVIKPYHEALWAETPEIFDVPVNVSITLLHAMHRRLVNLLRHFKPEDWLRTYFHPEKQREVPLWEVVCMYAWHSKHHVEQLRALKERNNW